MPGLRVAINSGSWSNPAIWNGGVLPGLGDTVCANSFNVTIDQNVNVDTLTTRAQSIVTATALMTSDTTPSGYIVTQSAVNGGEPLWRAFDRNTGTRGWVANNVGWVSYEFPSPVTINKYVLAMYPQPTFYAIDFELQGWDGSNWITLHTVSGNTLNTYNSPSINNTTAYKKYRIYHTNAAGGSVIYQEISLYELYYDTNGIAGGGFVISSSNNITLTGGGLIGGTGTCLLFSGSSGISSSLNTTAIVGPDANSSVTLRHNGAGTLTVACTTYSPAGSATNRNTITFTSNGILNYSGGGIGGNFGTPSFVVTGTGTINIVASVNGGSNTAGIDINSNATINITGNVTGGGNTGRGISITSNSTTNITGNVSAGSSGPGITTNAGCIINITGNISGTNSYAGVDTAGTATRLNIIGILTNAGYHAAYSTSTSAINLLSGPFICSTYGGFPYYVARMHLIPTLNNYIEFRDNSTNGALSPGPIASASRMVSADTIIDAPSISNVRFGVSYGNGAFTGTCRIPSASNVALNVPFDTGSIGTAYIDANTVTNQVWGTLTGSLTTPGSIGERLKNSSTVDTTGAQLVSLL